MFKALKELGFRRSYNYLFYAIYSKLLDFCLLPPLRVFLLKLAGAEIGKNSIVEEIKFINLHHSGFSNLKIGKDCIIAKDCLIDLSDVILFGNNVILGPRVTLLTHTNIGYQNHPLKKFYPLKREKIILRNNCYLGSGCVILPGIEIGEKSVIAAGGVVNSNVPKNKVYGGVPAKEIKNL